MVEWVSVGEWCIAAHQLERHGLRNRSYPFDWAFSSLRHVTAEMRGECDLFSMFESESSSPVFPEEVHHIVTFPHRDKMANFPKTVRNWTNLWTRPDQAVNFIYVTRDGDAHVEDKIKAFESVLRKKMTNYLIFNVRYELWENHQPVKKVNRMRWERSGRVIRAIASISHAWDGHNWGGGHHQKLWDAFFEQAAKFTRDDDEHLSCDITQT